MKQDKLFHRILKILLIVFMSIGALVLLLLFLAPSDPMAPEEVDLLNSRVGIIINYGIILLIIGAAIAVIFPLITVILNPKNAIKLLLVVVLLVVFAGLSYIFASGNIDGAVYEKFEITTSTSKMVGGALILTYILIGLAIVSIIFSSIRKMLK